MIYIFNLATKNSRLFFLFYYFAQLTARSLLNIFEISLRLSLLFANAIKISFRRYLEDIALKTDSRNDPILKLALFGVGRAGTIHLMSIISNARVELLYIVDDVESNWQNMRKYWHLKNVTFLNGEQSDKVFKDPK